MITAFEDRVAEIEGYYEFVVAFEEGRLIIEDGELSILSEVERTGPDGQPTIETVIKPVSPDLLGTLRAAFYLLIYNLVESSMRNVVLAITDELVEKRVAFPSIKQELRTTIIRHFGKIGKAHHDRILSSLGDVTADVIGNSFQPDLLFSGNVDAKRIREIATEYGFPCTPIASDATNIGQHILAVKSNRNDLAHGVKSFVEVGRDKGKTDLDSVKNATVSLLRAVLTDVDAFITARDYLDAPHGA